MEQKYPSQKQSTYVPGLSPKYSTIWGRNMDTKHTTGEKLLATEMDYWRRSARKSRKEKVRNGTIRAIMEVGGEYFISN
jgi:hypothetical protein